MNELLYVMTHCFFSLSLQICNWRQFCVVCSTKISDFPLGLVFNINIEPSHNDEQVPPKLFYKPILVSYMTFPMN